MSKRIILITGANKGIGFETARQLGQQGHTVLVGARDEKKANEAVAKLAQEGITAHPVALDVDSSESIAKAVQQIETQFGKLDSLINNAGVALEGWGVKTTGTSLEVWRKVFETNLFAVASVTHALLPLLHKSELGGRIVNLSSFLGSLAFHVDSNSPIYHFKQVAYDSSKTALNQYTVHLAYELRDTPIKVNAADPGWVKTDLGGENAPMNVEDGAKTSVWLATVEENAPTAGFFHMQDRVPW